MSSSRTNILKVAELLLLGLWFLAGPAPVFAYIDPNIGGQVYQMLYPIIAIALGIVAFFRQWLQLIWQHLRSFAAAALQRIVG